MTQVPQAVVAIQKRFQANFTDAPIAYENEPPTDRDVPFVRMSIQFGPTTPSLDSGFERTTGIVYLVVLVPKGLGDIKAWTLAGKCADVLKYKTFDGVRLTSADFTNVGILGDALEQDSGWFQINVSVPFWIENFPNN